MSTPSQTPPAAADDEQVYIDKPNTTNYKGLFTLFLLVVPAVTITILVVQWYNEVTYGIAIQGLGTTLVVLVFGIFLAITILQGIEKSFTKKIMGIQRVYIDGVYPPPQRVAYDAAGSEETDLDIEDLVTMKWFGLYLDKCSYIDVDDATIKALLDQSGAIDPSMEAALDAAINTQNLAQPPGGKTHYTYHLLLDRPMYYVNVLGEVCQILDPIVVFPAELDKCVQRHHGNVPSNGFRYDHPDTDHLVLVYQVTILGDLPVYYAAYSSYNRDQITQPSKLSQELATNIAVKTLTFLYGEKTAELDPINQMRVKAEARTSAVKYTRIASDVKDISAPPADTAARDAFNRYKMRWGPKGTEIPVYWFVTIAVFAMFLLKLFGVY